MKTIQLTKGYETLVDDEDYDFLMQWKWHTMVGKNNLYAWRNSKKGEIGWRARNDRYQIQMHRVILGLTDKKIKGDHIDHNGLNNQRCNLREATQAENCRNKSSHKNSSSKYLGVYFVAANKRDGTITDKWKSSICHNGIYTKIGSYKTEIEAAIAYNTKAKEIHGNFANLNKIESNG